jgi:Mg-chelatase subunit ChlD
MVVVPPSTAGRRRATPAGRRGRLSVLIALAAIALVPGHGPLRVSSPQASAQGRTVPSTYRLAATWHDAPWTLTAGRYGRVSDVSSAPDGTIYVLDGRWGAVHVLTRDGTPRAVFRLPDLARDGLVARRLDVGLDGTLWVLSDASESGGMIARVDRLSGDGEAIGRFDIPSARPAEYRDLAAAPDGNVYVSRIRFGALVTVCERASLPRGNGFEVFSPAGDLLARVTPAQVSLPDSLDVAADGTVYLVNKLTAMFCPPPGPAPTPPPSLGRPAGSRVPRSPLQATPQLPDPVEGVVILTPDHRYRETIPFSGAEDVAVGPAGAFVSRHVEVYALGDAAPLYSGPAGQFATAFYGQSILRLDVPAGGGLVAGMAHCAFQGLVLLDDVRARPAPARYVGATDDPALDGPRYPVRLAADADVAVLQGRFFLSGDGEDRTYYGGDGARSQAVQRWSRAGVAGRTMPLRSQLGVCTGGGPDFTRDVAVDGENVYTVDPNLVQQRPDDLLPAWITWPLATIDPDRPAQLVAVAADAGRIAVLDGATASVYVLASDGALLADWTVARAEANAVPVDLAVRGDRVYLADRGRGRVLVRGLLDGADLGAFPTHDGPLALAAGGRGDVFVLGRGGWGFRYAADGRLVGTWPMPSRAVDALDIAVDVDGRVYVSFVEQEPMGSLGLPRRGQGRQVLLRAGIWVFEPAPAAEAPTVPPGACVARPDKSARPPRLPLGGTVDVTLTVDGHCPGRYDPVQVAIVMDTSRSMNFDAALARAREGVLTLLAALDPRAAEVALVSFDEGALLELPLTRNLAEVAARVSALEAWGDTWMGAGIDLAVQELTGPRADAAARRIIVLVTDGVPKDEPWDAADAARAAGLIVHALVFPTAEFDPFFLPPLGALTGDMDRVWLDPDATGVSALADDLVRYRPETGVFEQITVNDVVPVNMTYLEGSAAPPATWEASTRTLTWTFGRRAADAPLLLTYRLRPLAVGTWPTNVEATAPYRDALGNDGRLVFPVPEVEVYAPAARLFLPLTTTGACLRKGGALDVVLVVDTSSSMAESGPNGRSKLDAARAATMAFLRLLAWPTDHAALVTFDRTAVRRTGLTGDLSVLDAALGGLTTTEGTHIDLGLTEARAVLAEGARPGATTAVVLLTDGLNNDGPGPVRIAADRLRAAGVLVFAIGLGIDVDAALLAAVATAPDGYYPSATTADLAAIYRRISARLACVRG